MKVTELPNWLKDIIVRRTSEFNVFDTLDEVYSFIFEGCEGDLSVAFDWEATVEGLGFWNFLHHTSLEEYSKLQNSYVHPDLKFIHAALDPAKYYELYHSKEHEDPLLNIFKST